jgi:hypothetical protein
MTTTPETVDIRADRAGGTFARAGDNLGYSCEINIGRRHLGLRQISSTG